MDINKRGIYTIVQVKPDLFKILILFYGDPNAIEVGVEFTDTGDAIRMMNLNAPHLKRSENKAFKMMWDTFKMEAAMKSRPKPSS